MKNTKIINRLIDFYLEGSELTQGEHNTVRSLKEEMQAINYTRCCKSDSEQLPDTNKHQCNCSNTKDKLDCGFECYNR